MYKTLTRFTFTISANKKTALPFGYAVFIMAERERFELSIRFWRMLP